MSDHRPRFIVREQHGVTVGDRWAEHDFLILDSWYGYAEVLWVKKDSGNMAGLRRRVYEYAGLLNNPRICKCGCGREVPVRSFERRSSGRQPFYASALCKSRAKHRRDMERRGRVA
jgi:hypothetical protein